MIRNGLKPTPHDRRDYSYIKTKKLAGIIPAFPDSYNTDVNLWMPDQNADGLPYGCTDYAQTDLLIDEDKKLYDPKDLENITHANAKGGIDLRTSLKAVVKLHPDHPAFLSVQPDIPLGGNLDFFDAVRVAIIMGKDENRAVSVGTPWLPAFHYPVNGVLPPVLTWPTSFIDGHNWTAKGWKTIDGNPYLICKSWQGKNFGDNGYCYFSRATFNRLMSIGGSVAYVLDKLLPNEKPETVSSTVKQWLVSFFYSLFS